jgi:hypothetical protein
MMIFRYGNRSWYFIRPYRYTHFLRPVNGGPAARTVPALAPVPSLPI